MDLPAYLESAPDGVRLRVKVQPRAARDELVGALGDALKIKVTAPPVDSAANDALVRFVAEVLDCPRAAVRIVRGRTARQKTLLIVGLPAGEIARRLGNAGPRR